MKTNPQQLVNFIKRQNGIASFSDILKAGFHPDSINILTKKNQIEKIARGFYKLYGNNIGMHPDIVTASLQAPRGVICLLSALFFHEATVEIPKYVDIAIPKGAHANRIKYPPVLFYHFDIKTWEPGIEEYRLEGQAVRIYNLAKTIADCFKFRNKIGINVARESLKIAISEKKIKSIEIMEYAKICRVDKVIKPILEAML